MAMVEKETKSSTENGGDGEGVSTKASKKKQEKKSRKRKKLPQPGDPGYKTPTQLRNARKRRKKKDDKAGGTGNTTKEARRDADSKPFGANHNKNDPSLKYLTNPKAAPTVRNAIKFFREKTNAQAGTNHDAYFPVTLGPKLGWRSVARLAVRVRKDDAEKRLRIGLFVPGSHELLPVPDCPVHNRKINGLVKVLEETCNVLSVPALDDDAEGGETDNSSTNNFGLRYIAVAVERTTGKQQLVLVWKEPTQEPKNNEVLENLVRKLVQMSQKKNKNIWLQSVWVHYNNTWKHSNSVFDRQGRWETKFVDGEKMNSSSSADANQNQLPNNDPLFGAIRETMLPLTTKATKNHSKAVETIISSDCNSTSHNISVPLYFPPQVFRQANLDGFARIIVRIREWLREQQSKEPALSLAPSSVDKKEEIIQDDSTLPPKRKRRRGKRDTSNTGHDKQEQQQDDKHKLSSAAVSVGKLRSLGHCLELYGGVGTIGLNLVDYFDSLDSSDENPFNEACFHAAADKIKIGDEENDYLDPTKRSKITYTSKSASEIVVEQYGSLKKARVVVVDPPRKGLDPPVIEALCSEYGGQQSLVYVSCGFDAFRRDYRALVEHSGKWTLDRAEGHILFPGSDAIETLAFFTRTE